MFKLPELDYPYNALEPFIDQKTVEIHYGKHHQNYTNNLNEVLKDQPDLQKMDVEKLLQNISVIPDNIKTKVINNGGGYYNHNLYWKFMSPKKSAPEDKLLEYINNSFGNLDVFREKFTNTALTHFGSGWGWLVVNSGKLEIVSTSNQNSPVSEGKTPILGIDVWEHAYYLKYQNRRADYINAWWNVVNWKQAERLFLGSLSR
jgi:Fe-Mn family superoxide dismutase